MTAPTTETPTTDAADAVDAVAAATGLPVLPLVNLLPPEIGERVRLQRLQLGLGAGVVAVAGAVTVLYLGAAAGVHEAQAELQAADRTAVELRTESGQFSDVLDVYAKADAARAMLTAAMGQEVRFSGLLDDLSRSVPDDVWLKTVEFNQAPPTASADPAAPQAAGLGTVTFTGVALKHDDVAVWLEALAQQKGYADATFQDSTVATIGERQVVTFTSSVTLTQAALSQRWTTGTGG